MLIDVANSIAELFRAHPVVQSVGFVAMVVGCLSFQGRTSKAIVVLQGIASAFWAIHFGFLGATAGALSNAIGVPRNAIYVFGKGRPWAESVFWPFFFCVMFLLGGLFSHFFCGESWVFILSVCGQVISTIIFRLKNAQTIRWLSIAMSLCWLIYDALAGSIPGTVCEIFNQISIYTALWRFRRR